MRGGKLIKKFRKMKVRGLAEHMPEEIVLNISKMDIEDTLRISDIKIPNIEILEVMGNLVLHVASTRAVEPTTPGGK
jgi:large subunit ribosomal protein L25